MQFNDVLLSAKKLQKGILTKSTSILTPATPEEWHTYFSAQSVPLSICSPVDDMQLSRSFGWERKYSYCCWPQASTPSWQAGTSQGIVLVALHSALCSRASASRNWRRSKERRLSIRGDRTNQRYLSLRGHCTYRQEHVQTVTAQ